MNHLTHFFLISVIQVLLLFIGQPPRQSYIRTHTHTHTHTHKYTHIHPQRHMHTCTHTHFLITYQRLPFPAYLSPIPSTVNKIIWVTTWNTVQSNNKCYDPNRKESTSSIKKEIKKEDDGKKKKNRRNKDHPIFKEIKTI